MKRQAWNWALGLNKIDNLKVNNFMKDLIEKEIKGEITLLELKKKLDRKMCKI